MKRISYVRPILIAWVIMSAVACTDNPVTPTPPSTQIIGTPAPQGHNMVASNWHADGYGNFVNEFGNLGITASTSQYTVFVIKNNVQTMISGGAINFEGGKLWAVTVQGNLTIFYRVDSGSSTTPFIPMNSLELVVVF